MARIIREQREQRIERIELVEGVQTTHNDTSYVIHVTEQKETGILGVIRSQKEADKIVVSMGRAILKDLQAKTDPNWVKIKIEKENMTYRIKVQKLGYIKNGPYKTYATVHAELVSNIRAAPEKSLQEQIRAHPLSFTE